MVRGIISQIDIFEIFLQSQMWIWRRTNLQVKRENKKLTNTQLRKKYSKFITGATEEMIKNFLEQIKEGIEIIQIQGALRRMPFGYEYIFPEECLAEVLTSLEIEPENNKEYFGLSGLKKWIIRNIIGNGVKKIPKYTKIPTNRFIAKAGVVIYPIGIKKDMREERKDWGYEQEML